MKKIAFLFLLSLVFALGCSKESASGDPSSAGSESTTADRPSEPAGTASSESSAPAATTEKENDKPAERMGSTVFFGRLGLYEQMVVMQVDIVEGEISGSYYYAKHGKPLELRGFLNPLDGTGRMTEFWKGKATGYFTFVVENGGSHWKGQWSAKEDMSGGESFVLKRLDANWDPDNAEGNSITGKYGYTHEVSIYTGSEENDGVEVSEARDDLVVNYIGDGFFSFYISVVRTNGHLGSVDGIARLNGKKGQIYEGEECAITFDFSGSGVETIEEDCFSYHGARASFDGTWERL